MVSSCVVSMVFPRSGEESGVTGMERLPAAAVTEAALGYMEDFWFAGASGG